MDNNHILLLARPGSPVEEIRGAVKEMGYEPVSVESPADALSAVARQRPLAVLIYLRDPVQGSRAAAAELLEIAPKVAPTPCVLIGPSADPALYLQALSLGVCRHIMVPCGKHFLMERVRAAAVSSGADDAGDRFEITLPSKDGNISMECASGSLGCFIDDAVRGAAHKNDLLRKCVGGRVPLSKSLVGNPAAAPPADAALYRECVKALENREFLLHYQPIVSMERKNISGFEALIRWKHPRRGLVSPSEFMPVVESSDLIVPVGFRVIEDACRQIGRWQKKFPSKEPLSVSVNVSARQFVHHELAEDIVRIVKDSGVPPRSVRFEITESAFMEDMEASNLMLLKLKAESFLLYMDDFGTGYSSLAYLKHFPVDVLKIDQSFVKYMDIDDESEIIVKAVIGLAHNLNMKVVGEGVESADHLSLLREFGCDYGQGYHFSPPLPPEEMEKLLEQDPRW